MEMIVFLRWKTHGMCNVQGNVNVFKEAHALAATSEWNLQSKDMICTDVVSLIQTHVECLQRREWSLQMGVEMDGMSIRNAEMAWNV